jgi:hypothetical protein
MFFVSSLAQHSENILNVHHICSGHTYRKYVKVFLNDFLYILITYLKCVHHVGLIIMKKIFLMFFGILPAQKCGAHCKLVLDVVHMFGQ